MTREDLGNDPSHHKCGGQFKLYVSPRFAGFQFSSDGYSYDELDVLDGGEDTLRCMECKAEFEFPDWQEVAEAFEAQAAPTHTLP